MIIFPSSLLRVPLRWGLMALSVILVACQSSSGERNVLPVDDMADVVYDYQMAIALAQQDEPEVNPVTATYEPISDSAEAASRRNYLTYRAAVLHKYHITEADYNHSLAFYLRNPDKMKQLNARLERKVAQASMANHAGTAGKGATANDSVLVWQQPHVLLDAATHNRFVQEVSVQQRKPTANEVLLLNFDAQWLYGGGNKQAQAFVTAVYDNDSVGVAYYSIYYFQNHHEVRLPLAQRSIKKIGVQFTTSSTWENYPQVVSLSRLKLHRVREASTTSTSQ